MVDKRTQGLQGVHIRCFAPADAEAVNAVAISAFAQYQGVYQDWDVLTRGVGAMASLANSAEILVACESGEVVGAVAYIPPGGSPRADFFEREWPIIRMLVVRYGSAAALLLHRIHGRLALTRSELPLSEGEVTALASDVALHLK